MALKTAGLKNEPELEALLVNDPDQIEKGFKVITNQRTKPEFWSRLDILGLDPAGLLTLIELKVVVDPGHFTQALKYYNLILEQGTEWYQHAYKEKIGSVAIKHSHMPQIYLIAPDFDAQVLLQVQYSRQDIAVKLFRYQVFEVNNRKEIVLNAVRIPEVREIEAKPWTMEDNIDYIAVPVIRDCFKKTIEKISRISEGIRVDAEGYGVKFWAMNGKKVCQVDPKKGYFNIGYRTKTSSKWEWTTDLVNEDQTNKVIDEKIKYAYELTRKGKE